MDRAEGKPEGGKVGASQLLAAVFSMKNAATCLAAPRGDTVAWRVRPGNLARSSAGGGTSQATTGPVALWCAG